MNMQVAHVTPIRRQGEGELASLFEAVLISAGRPLSLDQLADAAGIEERRARRVLEVLRSRYDDSRGICVSWDGTRVELGANPRFAGAVERIARSGTQRSLDLIEEYLSVQRQRGRRPGTLEAYRTFMERFARALGCPIDEAETKHVRRFLLDEEKRGNGPATIASKVFKLSSLYKWLEREEYITRNPMLRIDAPRIPSAPPKHLTHEEIERLRDAAEGFDRLLLEVLYSSGIRVSEAVALDWHDIDLNAMSLTVREGKGGKTRQCPLSTRAVLLLRQHQDERKDHDPWVFRSQWRRRISKSQVERRTIALGERAGLRRKLTPHKLRHSCATHLLAAGMPLEMVQHILGHESIRTTQIYAKTQTQQIDQYYRRVFP